MKVLRRNLGNILISLCELMAGILLLINPVEYTKVLIIIVGVALVILGGLNVITHLRIPPLEASRSFRMSFGLILIAGGAFCMFDTSWFTRVFPVLPMLYGVAMIAVGIIKIQWTIDMLRIRDTKWYLALISVAVDMIMAILIFTNLIKNENVLWIITAIVLILCALLDLVTLFFRARRQQEVARTYKKPTDDAAAAGETDGEDDGDVSDTTESTNVEEDSEDTGDAGEETTK